MKDIDSLLKEDASRWRSSNRFADDRTFDIPELAGRGGFRKPILLSAGVVAAVLIGVAIATSGMLQSETDGDQINPLSSATPGGPGSSQQLTGKGYLARTSEGELQFCASVGQALSSGKKSSAPTCVTPVIDVDEAASQGIHTRPGSELQRVMVTGSITESSRFRITNVVPIAAVEAAPNLDPPAACEAPPGGWPTLNSDTGSISPQIESRPDDVGGVWFAHASGLEGRGLLVIALLPSGHDLESYVADRYTGAVCIISASSSLEQRQTIVQEARKALPGASVSDDAVSQRVQISLLVQSEASLNIVYLTLHECYS